MTSGFKIICLLFFGIILLAACNGTPPVSSNTSANVTTTAGLATTTITPAPRLVNVTLDMEGYGYRIGDVVSVDQGARPQIGDVVYYESTKNEDYCTSFGPGYRLAKIAGKAGDSVVYTAQSYEIDGQTYDLGKTRISGKLMWGDMKYDTYPLTVLKVPSSEYMADSWLGFECPGDVDSNGNSVMYNRYTVKNEAIIGVVLARVAHDDVAEKEILQRVY